MSSEEKIFIASDHAAFKLKETIKEYLQSKGYLVNDLGTNSEDSTDYAPYAHQVADAVIKEKSKGILLCGSGIGMSIAANRHAGIRAALCHNTEFAKLSREHNDSNVLILPGRYLNEDETKKILDTWLNTDFAAGRHLRRIGQIDNGLK